MNKKEQVIYLAGMIDGDGHFGCPLTSNGRGEKRYYPIIIVTNTNRELMDWLKETFGGTIATVKPRFKHWQIYYQWKIQGKKVEELTKKMQPYLIVRKKQSECVGTCMAKNK